MKRLTAEAMDAGAVGFATSVSKVHVGYSGRPVPSRLAGFDEMLEIADAVGRAGHGIIQYNVGRDPRWEEYEALVAKSGRPWYGRRCWRARSAQLARPQLARQASRSRAACRDLPAGRLPAIQIEFDFHSPVVFDTWASFAAAREAPDDAARRAVYADAAFRARVKRQADGRGPDDAVFMGKELEGDTRRAAFWTYVSPRPGIRRSRTQARGRGQGTRQARRRPDARPCAGGSRHPHARLAAQLRRGRECADIIKDPNVVMIASATAVRHLSQLCDACYSTHLLGHWVREDGALSLEQAAVHRLTGATAALFGLSDRGRLAVGLPADIVVFDPATVGASALERVNDLPARRRPADRPSARHPGRHRQRRAAAAAGAGSRQAQGTGCCASAGRRKIGQTFSGGHPMDTVLHPEPRIQADRSLAVRPLRAALVEHGEGWSTGTAPCSTCMSCSATTSSASLTYDNEHHRLAVVNVEGLHEPDDKAWGLAHVAYTFRDIGELLSTGAA